MPLLLLPAFGGFCAGRAGHYYGGHVHGVPHHWIPGACAVAYGLAARNPAVTAAGVGMMVSDWHDLVALRFWAPSAADLLPRGQRRFWALD